MAKLIPESQCFSSFLKWLFFGGLFPLF